jgi:hypothetical protein
MQTFYYLQKKKPKHKRRQAKKQKMESEATEGAPSS